MRKEILIGAGLGLLAFLFVIGVNVTPFILAGTIMAGFFFFMHMQGKANFKLFNRKLNTSPAFNFSDIGGQESAIKELSEALQFLITPDYIAQMGIRPIKGVLLAGPPGTGKTLLARAAASYTGSAFIAVAGSEFIEMYAGVGAKRVRQLFMDARKKAAGLNCRNAIVFIDELEVLGAKRGSHSNHMEYDQTLNQLLVEMDGISPDEEPRILVIGATNRADMLDPALIRPGRFDRQVQVGLPDKQGRLKILNIHTKNKPIENEKILEEVARATFGFSGAHLESLANEAAILAMREKMNYIEARHFTEAIDKVIMGEKLERKPTELELQRVSIHESGHALMSETLNPGSVATLTIIPRGGALGYVRRSAQDDQYLFTKAELEEQIMVALAGAVAEETVLGDRSTGAKNDFAQAWQIAKEIVESGLSDLGIIDLTSIPKEQLYQECRNIIALLEDKIKEIIEQHKDLLVRIAETAREEETMSQARIRELFV